MIEERSVTVTFRVVFPKEFEYKPYHKHKFPSDKFFKETDKWMERLEEIINECTEETEVEIEDFVTTEET